MIFCPMTPSPSVWALSTTHDQAGKPLGELRPQQMQWGRSILRSRQRNCQGLLIELLWCRGLPVVPYLPQSEGTAPGPCPQS